MSERKHDNLISGALITSGVGLGAATEISRKKYQLPKGHPKTVAIIHSPASRGGGHASAAEALANILKTQEGVDVKLIDVGKANTNYIANKYLYAPSSGYIKKVQEDPHGAFKRTVDPSLERKSLSARIKNTVNSIFYELRERSTGESRAIAKELQQAKPDKIISTYFGVVPGLADMNKKIDVLTTDYSASPALWKQPNVGTYYVPSKITEKALIRQGVKASDVVNIGDIPARLTISDVPKLTKKVPENVVVMGGSLGLRTEEVGPLVAQYFKERNFNTKVHIFPGHGDVAKEKLKKIPLPENVFIHPADKKILDKVLKEADLVVSRPGGATTAELRLLGKPAVLYTEFDPNTPYHESGNVKKILNSKQGVHVQLTPKKYEFAENYKRISKALDEVIIKYPNYAENAQKVREQTLQNYKNIAAKILETPTKEHKGVSRLTRTGRIGAATLILGGGYKLYKDRQKRRS